MQTVLDLPEDLLTKAKMNAERAGVDLSSFVADCIERTDCQTDTTPVQPDGPPYRRTLPKNIRHATGMPKYNLTNDQIDQILSERV